MMELKRKATAARTRNGTYDRNADELEKIFQDAGNALKAEFEEGYSAGYADAWQEIKKVVAVPFPVSWTVKMKKKQKETQDILSYHTQAAGCSDKARAKASGGRQPIEECGRTGL